MVKEMDSQRSEDSFTVNRNKRTQRERKSHQGGVDVIGVRSLSEAAENQSLIS